MKNLSLFIFVPVTFQFLDSVILDVSKGYKFLKTWYPVCLKIPDHMPCLAEIVTYEGFGSGWTCNLVKRQD